MNYVNNANKSEFVHNIIEWGKNNLRNFPWRETDDPLIILIVEVFLQRTPAERVNTYFDKIIELFLSKEIKIERIESELNQLGLKKRITWLKESIIQIQIEFGGKVPENPQILKTLKGVGNYTANAISCMAFNKVVPMVDINVKRGFSRVFNINLNTMTEKDLLLFAQELVPTDSPKLYNLSLIDHSTIVCGKKPLCGVCSLIKICYYHSQ